MEGKRAVITGLGIVAPNGIGWRRFWQNSLGGASYIRKISRFDSSDYTCQIAGEVTDFQARNYVHQKILKQTDRCTHMALAAAQMALQDSNLSLQQVDPTRVGMVFSNLLGGMEFAEPELYKQWTQGPKNISAYQSIAWFYAATQGQWSISKNIKGYAKTLVSDRAGGLQALGWGAHIIKAGIADVVFAGGFEAPLAPFAFLCHQTSGILCHHKDNPEDAYRPFDVEHSGTVIAEGAAILVLEEYTHARKRDAEILAEISGFAANCDGYHPINAMPNGKYLAKCVKQSLSDASITPAMVDYIGADGCATDVGDLAETLAIKEVFGQHAYKIGIGAPKSMIGHSLAAAGAIDTVWTTLMLREGVMMPTINWHAPAPGCDLDYVPNEPRTGNINHALIVGRGEGGINCALVISKC